MFHWLRAMLQINYETAYWDTVAQSEQWVQLLSALQEGNRK